MTGGDTSERHGTESLHVVSCDLSFAVTEPADLIFQVAAAISSGPVLAERFEIRLDGEMTVRADELEGPHGTRLHVVHSPCGELTVAYRAEVQAPPARSYADVPSAPHGTGELGPSIRLEEINYLRPSRYCPTDHLVGFASAEFGSSPNATAQVAAITEWIGRRIEYVIGSSNVHDSAEDTLLTGAGTCRDFAHLAVALCRAIGVASRFTAVYAPGLSPMDFHAVFETLEGGRWLLHDATELAPRNSMVRIVTGRDAADAAFASVLRGTATLERLDVSATVGSFLPADDPSLPIELP